MAMIKCDECGKDISDRAAACPNCGGPVQVLRSLAAPSFRVLEEKRRNPPPARLIGLGVLGLALAAALVSFYAIPARQGKDSSQMKTAPPTPPPAPKWQIVNTTADTNCGNILDSCIQIHCMVANAGDAPGTVRITAFLQNATQTLEKSATTFLAPGTKEKVTIAFPDEVHTGDSFDNYRCSAES